MPNFALIGAAGFVAPRHLQAIRDTGNDLVAAVDPFDAVGVLDRFFPETRFFPEIERFDRFLEKQRRRSDGERVHYVSICSPNYLHDAHVRLALRVGAQVICEKPLVISPWNLDQLADLEVESGCRVFTVLQLRLHPALIALKQRIQARPAGTRASVILTYITPRGPWYHLSWKGNQEKSGGLAMNIGIHFFDLLLWLFGDAEEVALHAATPQRVTGALRLKGADVLWYLSIDREDLSLLATPNGGKAYRSITIDGAEVDFSEGFVDLHTRVYQDVLDGGGFGISHARPSIELVHRIRHGTIESGAGEVHPLLATQKKRSG